MKRKSPEGDGELAKWSKSWNSLKVEVMEWYKGIGKNDVVVIKMQGLFRFFFLALYPQIKDIHFLLA